VRMTMVDGETVYVIPSREEKDETDRA
jgi:hypothetical protein